MSVQSVWSRASRLGLGFVACVLLSSALPACSRNTPTEASSQNVEDDRDSFHASIQPSAMAQEDLANYKAELAYVRSLVQPGETIFLNHADDRQHRFAMARLKLAGKTPQNSPELFEQLDKMRVAHTSKGERIGTATQALGGNGRKVQHYVPSFSFVSDTAAEAMATVSSQNDIFYGYVDAALWSATTEELLGPMDVHEVYSPGTLRYVTARTVGTLPAYNPNIPDPDDYVADTYMVEDTVLHGFRDSFQVKTNNRRGPKFTPATITGPVNTVGDACISVCLNRTWTGDCDYDLTGTPGALALPLSGSITLDANNYSFDMAQILAFRAGTTPGGQIRVVLADSGGGCDVDSNNALYLPMQAFWNTVTISPDGQTLSWNMTGANVAVFDPSCRLVQDNIELAMNITLPWVQTTSGSSGTSPLYLSNNPGKGTLDFSCIDETNSCLAAGTVIQMADGRGTPIESLHTGDRVFNPFEKTETSLTVADTAKGFETVPMVRIEDEKGRTLLMTEKHPLQVVGLGMVMAQQLKEGDMVTTQSGPSRLVRITREKYDGTVHNLKVGTSAETQSLGKDQTVVYANGFLVGDGQIQSKYESLELAAKKSHGSPLSLLPAGWQRDYKNSARR